jgi:hypothetical protein
MKRRKGTEGKRDEIHHEGHEEHEGKAKHFECPTFLNFVTFVFFVVKKVL